MSNSNKIRDNSKLFIRLFSQGVYSTGCEYVFGSWTWKHGWTWDNKDDPLPILDIQSYGLTTAVNASSRLFTKCGITSIDKYCENGAWEALDPVFYQGTNVVFFKLQGMWHFTWVGNMVNFILVLSGNCRSYITVYAYVWELCGNFSA